MPAVLRYVGSLCAALALVSFSGVSVAAASIPTGPRLALLRVSLFPFRYDLETVNETGALPMRVIGGGERKRPLPEPYVQPSWSPDGLQIVFSALSHGTRLYVSDADGNGLHRLDGTHGADEPLFAPDGASVAFAHYRYRQKVNRRGEKRYVAQGADIWVADLAGGAPSHMTHTRNGVYVYPESVSPDGHTLLAGRYVEGKPWEVVQIDLETGRSEVMLHRAFGPVFSPDGSRVAFLRWGRRRTSDRSSPVTSDLFTVKANGGGLRRLTDSPGDEQFASWDPSGRRLAFVRYLPEGSGELAQLGFGSAVMQVNSDGSCLETIIGASMSRAFFGTAWQPGPGREAGRIVC